jgi:hypothetical protein
MFLAFPVKRLTIIDISETWSSIIRQHYYKYRGYMIFMHNEKISYMGVRIIDFKAANIMLTERDNNTQNCQNDFVLEFSAGVESDSPVRFKDKAKRNFNMNKIMFDTSKSFIIKNGERYNLREGKNNKIVNISEELLIEIELPIKELAHITVAHNSQGIDKIAYFNLTSPFGCRSLEGTILEIGGIWVNGEELEPIRIKMEYESRIGEWESNFWKFGM